MASTKIALIVSLTIFIAFSGKNITNYCRTAVKINRPVTNILKRADFQSAPYTVCCLVSGRFQYPDTYNKKSIFEAPFSVLGKRSTSNES